MDLSGITFVDSIEQIEDPLKEGDFVRVKFGVRGKTRNRKAELIGIDELSSMGSYPDRYTVSMCKTGEEIDCTRQVIERWQAEARLIQRSALI